MPIEGDSKAENVRQRNENAAKKAAFARAGNKVAPGRKAKAGGKAPAKRASEKERSAFASKAGRGAIDSSLANEVPDNLF